MNYRLPIDFYGFFQKIELSKNKKGARFKPVFDHIDDVTESIDQFIDLLVFTHHGECRFQHDFGFSFWDNEFSNISIQDFNTREKPKKDFEDDLKNVIETFETRLKNVQVEILLSEEDAHVQKSKIKFMVLISITGKIKAIQSKPYKKQIVFSVGPVAKK